MRKNLKKTTKRAILAASLAGVAAAGMMTTGGLAYASNTGTSSMANAIAGRFKLKSAEVQQVMDSEHEKRHDQHLEQLVKAGKLTQEQADKLKAKQKEMEPKREAARNEADATKRKAAMDAIRNEMDQWVKDNGIDLSDIRPARGIHGPGGHMGMGGMMHDRNDSDTPPAQ